MLRRVTDVRRGARRDIVESRSKSITTRDEEVESCADIGRAVFALVAESV
jgi:hypothetical protein